jgi:hypothetical protein
MEEYGCVEPLVWNKQTGKLRRIKHSIPWKHQTDF